MHVEDNCLLGCAAEQTGSYSDISDECTDHIFRIEK